jgi:hypothetical protein
VSTATLDPAAFQRFNGGMSDPIPGNDSSAAYDVIPSQDWPHGWTVTCNGIPVRYFVNKAMPSATPRCPKFGTV